MKDLLRLFSVTLLLSVALCESAGSESAGSEAENRPYEIPHPTGVFFYEAFEPGWEERWQASGKEKFASGEWAVGQTQGGAYLSQSEQGLILKKAAQHHAISHKFAKPIGGKEGKDLVIQYEVRLNEYLQCGGAYLKLLAHDPSFKTVDFDNTTPYVIMFGPDKCGNSDKVHFIFRHQSPTTKKWEEKHLVDPPKIKSTDTRTHLYTLVIRADNTYEMYIDLNSVKKGSLHTDFAPAVNPPKEIDDPTDSKPADWVDEAKIRDPEARKPDDWDEDAPRTIVDESATKPEGWCDECELLIADPEASKPDDWDEETDGEWEAPRIANPICEEIGCGEWTKPNIANPAYKGKWQAPMIDNPAYKGVWKARQIPNPDYFEDANPHRMAPIGGIGFELWTMQNGIEFDNIFIDHSEDAAFEWATGTWSKKDEWEKSVMGVNDDGEDFMTRAGYWISENFKVFMAIAVGVVTVVIMGLVYCCKGEEQPRPVRPAAPASPPASPPAAAPKEDKGKAAAVAAGKKKAEPEPQPVPSRKADEEEEEEEGEEEEEEPKAAPAPAPAKPAPAKPASPPPAAAKPASPPPAASKPASGAQKRSKKAD